MKKRNFALVAVLLLFTAFLASCSSEVGKSTADYDYNYSKDIVYETTTAYFPSKSEAMLDYSYADIYDDEIFGSSAEYERKIISTCRLDAETKEFDKAIESIEQSIKAQGGYIENSYVSGVGYNKEGYASSRYANYTLRIPAQALDGYIISVESLLNVTGKSQSADDISDTYYDTKARLESLEVQEARLLSMLEESADLDSLIRLEEKLSEVRYNIERLTATINRYDNSVSFATVQLNIREVVEYTDIEEPVTFGQRMKTAFGESWSNFADGVKDFFVAITYALPSLIVFAVFVLIVVFIVVSSVKKHRKKMKNTDKYTNSDFQNK